MKLQDYKKLITAAFVNNTRRGFAEWRDCGGLCRDVTDGLEGAKEGLCAENRYADLFELCNWTLKKIAAHPKGRELAAELAAKYRAQYPRRSAMIDELKRF